MAKRTASTPKDPQKLSFEQAVEELQQIITQSEDGEIGLEESLAQRTRGEAIVKRCRAILDAAEQEIETISVEEDADEE